MDNESSGPTEPAGSYNEAGENQVRIDREVPLVLIALPVLTFLPSRRNIGEDFGNVSSDAGIKK